MQEETSITNGGNGDETPLLDSLSGAQDDGASNDNPSGNPEDVESLAERVKKLEAENEIQRRRADTYEGRYRAELRNKANGGEPNDDPAGDPEISATERVMLDRSREDRKWVESKFKERDEIERLSQYVDKDEARRIFELIE